MKFGPAGIPGATGVSGAHPAAVVMVSASVETVPPNAKALPVHVTMWPIVIPASSMSVPRKVEFAPSVVATGVQNVSLAHAPFATLTAELATVLSAPVILKIYVPAPVRVIPAVPIEPAPTMQ